MVLTLMPCCVVLFEASHDVHKKRCNVDALIERFFEKVYGQKRHHGGRVAAAPESKASREAVGNLTVPPTEDPATMPAP